MYPIYYIDPHIESIPFNVYDIIIGPVVVGLFKIKLTEKCTLNREENFSHQDRLLKFN